MNKIVSVSKYMSYLLRHNPKGLDISKNGFVLIDDLLEKLREKYPNIDKKSLEKVIKHGKKRFQIKNDKIRALYGHSIPVNISFEDEIDVDFLYHGTSERTAEKILKEGLKPQSRNKVHLSPSKNEAIQVGKRHISNPVILKIDVGKAIENNVNFFKATDNVYLSDTIPAKYIST